MAIENSNRSRELWGLLADTLAIIWFVAQLKTQVDTAIDSLGLSDELNFYTLFFWAFVAAFAGGFFWNIIVRLNARLGFLGSTQPHLMDPVGHGIVVWSVITLLPAIAVLIFLTLAHQMPNSSARILTYVAFMAGSTLGALIFYEYPQVGHRGVRSRLARHGGSVQNSEFSEFWMVLIWSLLLCVPGFLLAMVINRALIPSDSSWISFATGFLLPTATAVGLTTLAVTFFLLAVGTKSDSVPARGIVASLFLRIGIFFGLFLM